MLDEASVLTTYKDAALKRPLLCPRLDNNACSEMTTLDHMQADTAAKQTFNSVSLLREKCKDEIDFDKNVLLCYFPSK